MSRALPCTPSVRSALSGVAVRRLFTRYRSFFASWWMAGSHQDRGYVSKESYLGPCEEILHASVRMRTIEWLQCSGRPASQRRKSSFLILSQPVASSYPAGLLLEMIGDRPDITGGFNLEAMGVGSLAFAAWIRQVSASYDPCLCACHDWCADPYARPASTQLFRCRDPHANWLSPQHVRCRSLPAVHGHALEQSQSCPTHLWRVKVLTL